MLDLSRRGLLAGAGLGSMAFAPEDNGRLDPSVFATATRPDTILITGKVCSANGLCLSGRKISTSAPVDEEAIAIANGRIMAVGPTRFIREMAAQGTKVIDLGGKRVTPGFYDAHAHPIESGVQLLLQVACDSSSIEEIKRRLRQRVEATKPGEWVVGFLYDDAKTERPLNRHDLDEVAPIHPILVTHRGGHTGFVNSAALIAAHIEETVADPPGGRFFRDDNGRLNGRVGDNAKTRFEELSSRAPTREEWRKGAELITKMFSSKGVTSAVDAAGSPEGLMGYVDAHDAGALKCRISCNIFVDFMPKMMAAGIKTGFGNEWVKVGAQKQFADGSISERTAWMSEPFLDMDGKFKGLQITPREELYAKAKAAHLAGWQLGVHANGDVAIDEVLGVFEQLQREAPRRDPRFRIEHCTLVNDALIKRMKAVGAIPIPFAPYVYFHGDVMHFYGKARTEHMFAMRSFIDAGLAPPSSSDYTASPSDPMMWLRSQVTRTDPTGAVWGPSQKITVQEAMTCGTINGARSTFDEHDRGTLEPGKLADLVVWDRDPLTADPMSLIDIKPERVMTGGQWVFEA
jgi:predicted amidohydrolase YtcJ